MKRKIILLLLAVLLLTGFIGAGLEKYRGATEPGIAATGLNEAPASTLEQLSPAQTTPSLEPIQPDFSSHMFKITYLDVGQADAALVACDGHYMLIDGGNVADSSLIYSFLQREGVSHLDYMVNTHPHEDHVGGLPGALNACTVDHVLCPVSSYDSKAFRDFEKYTVAQGTEIEIPNPGDSFELGYSSVKILGPLKRYESVNNLSIVLRIDYGNTSFLFTGDMERDAEMDLLDYWEESELKSTVLKIGHHGSDTSTSYYFLWAVEPSYAVISVGENNTYGHPTENTLSRLRDADIKVYRTDLQGDILCTSDGTSLTFTVERNEAIDTLSPAEPNSTQRTEMPDEAAAEGITYVLNTNTHKFHYPSCSSVSQMSENNKIYFTGTREEAIGKGYTPCGRCQP